jgi:splicing factor 3B subunit 4
MNGQFLCNRQIVVQYAFKKESKGERHGSQAERLIAANNPQRLKPHTMFGTGPLPGMPQQMMAQMGMMPMGMMPPMPPMLPPPGYQMPMQAQFPMPPVRVSRADRAGLMCSSCVRSFRTCLK